jgi:AcrR family transcriptional regulator
MHPKNRRESQREATRRLLLQVAREVFTQHGFAAASIGEICRRAQVTHGALYHHFESKTELFAAVLQELVGEVAERVSTAAESASGWASVQAAWRAYLDACLDPSVQAVLLRDGPAVLTEERFDSADSGVNEPLVQGLLARWIDEGVLVPLPVPVTARILGGAFEHAGMLLSRTEETERVREELEVVFEKLLSGLRA